jgi:nucleophosmin 1
MFWGLVLKPGASHTLKEEEGSLLHLSAACLHEPKDAGRSALQVKTDEGSFTLAVLQKDAHEMASFDLFFNTMAPPTFHNSGKNEIHLSGYFELSGDEDEPLSDEEDEEEDMPIQGLKKKALPETAADSEEDDDEEDDDEEIDSDDMEEMDSDDEEMDDEDDDEEDDEDEEEEAAPAPVPVKNANGKRPAPAATAAPAPAAKATKTQDPAESFTSQLKEFLKTSGKTAIGMLGAKVKKPEAVSQKLKAFLLSRKEFKVVGDNVELA